MSARLIIFDCDGTLVDSQHMIAAAMTRAFAGEGLQAPDHHAILSVVGLSLPEAIWRLAMDQDEAAIRRLCDAYKGAFFELRATEPQEALYPGASEALDALLAEGAVLGIATGKSQRGVRHLLERYGLQDHFATIQTADDAPSKPHPAMIVQAMEATGMGAAATVMVGDTEFDMEMAANAGVAGLGVAWGYHAADRLLQAGARHVAEDFPALMTVLAGTAQPEEVE